MVLVSDKKYACETCIKGHRSSACKHTDRPLFEIKKKGRPVTQCEHCRELRKTKQVHVKCLCGVQDSSNPPFEASHSKKGAAKVPAIAAFPHGLPEDLETIAILPAVSDGSVDSDHSGETSPSGCRCSKGEICDCCTPRKPPGRRRSSVHHDAVKVDRHPHAHQHHHPHHHHSESSHKPNDPPQPLSSHVLARIAELRPVLPRPPRADGPLHDPSSSIPHTHSSRHHTHENMYFSPYGRAYEHVHTPDHHEHKPAPQMEDKRASPMRHQPPMQQNMVQGSQSTFDAWQPAPDVFPSACTCGDSCACPGCAQHSNAPIPPGSAYGACCNPASCSFCLDCTILSLPASSAPPNTDLSSDSQTREFEEWLRQVSGAPAGTMGMQTPFSPYDPSINQMVTFLNPNHTRSSQLPSPAEGHCQGRPDGPSGSGTGSTQRSGRSPTSERDGRSNGSTSQSAYAISGERNPSVDKPPDPPSSAGMSRRNASIRVPDYMTMTSVRDGLTASMNMRSPQGFYSDQTNYMAMGEAPSRSSSSSSLSSRMSARSPISPNTTGVFHNAPSGGSGSQPRPTNSYGAYAQPQPTRPGGQYGGYPFGSMQFPQ